jgi:hypothetical protein
MSDINQTTTTPIDDEHALVVVDSQRAWVVDGVGKRVSKTWTIADQETLDAFTERCLKQGRAVVAFISPGN